MLEGIFLRLTKQGLEREMAQCLRAHFALGEDHHSVPSIYIYYHL